MTMQLVQERIVGMIRQRERHRHKNLDTPSRLQIFDPPVTVWHFINGLNRGERRITSACR